jgi:hypothetical protein
VFYRRRVDPTFFEVELRAHPIRRGACELPILYRDASLVGVFFRVNLERAREIVGDKQVEPWPLLGSAVAALHAWEYRESSVGSYGEVGLGIQCRRRGTHPSLLRLGLDMRAQEEQGIWVVSLPVTTDAAFEAGVDLWGYPKYVTPIDTRFDEAAKVRLGGELEIEAAPMRGPWTSALPLVTYTERDGRLIRTVLEVDHRVRWDVGARVRVRLVGDGPTASAVRALGLAEARPIAAFRTDGFRAKLPAGTDLGPIR